MAKRYGRNKRREHRLRIAELEQRLRSVDTTGLYLAEGSEPPIAYVLEYTLEEHGIANDRVRLSADLRIGNLEDGVYSDLIAKAANSTPVQFMGRRFLISCIDQPYADTLGSLRDPFRLPEVTITLAGVSQRR